jgi:hypothetical protein
MSAAWSKAETHCCLDGKPFATQADYDTIPDGQGEHLCWSQWDGSVNCPDPLAVALALRGEVERLQRACGEQTEQVRRWRNRASRYRLRGKRAAAARAEAVARAERAEAALRVAAATFPRCGAVHPEGERRCTAHPLHVDWDGQGIDTRPHVFHSMGWPIEWTDESEGAQPSPWLPHLDTLRALSGSESTP